MIINNSAEIQKQMVNHQQSYQQIGHKLFPHLTKFNKKKCFFKVYYVNSMHRQSEQCGRAKEQQRPAVCVAKRSLSMFYSQLWRYRYVDNALKEMLTNLPKSRCNYSRYYYMAAAFKDNRRYKSLTDLTNLRQELPIQNKL